MTAGGRMRITIGVIATILAVVGGFAWLNYTMSRVISQKARLDANTYSVSVDYPGIIEQQYTDIGQKVKAGDKLFEIKSAALSGAIESEKIQRNTLLFDLAPNGNIIVKANQDGIVQSLSYRQGSYVPANTQIANISVMNSLYVTATYHLRAPDYARINKGNPVEVTLPDNTHLKGKIFDVTLQQDGNQVATIVKARLDQDKINTVAFASGTPVETSWRLNNNAWYEAVTNLLKRLFIPTTDGQS